MTRNGDQINENMLVPQPDDTTEVEDGQENAMNMKPGRGARQEPGAAASDEYVEEHVARDTTPDLPDVGNDER
ncbi:hypothetical protein [Deinococcus sp. Leaf326]|jgi:hypothetical protein|uniref:hypothetical protein n=1 Tax=Deinococcus sp. Leaf326 TaxID=1736338 RepID=UPI000701798E|nr:hypothetical protein [Deinococcus sp. Leaf326]KQR40840.1 hypothetical protein ASF71_01385 [Deinococcus sp. Leaf326]